jgi:hypothetical protein
MVIRKKRMKNIIVAFAFILFSTCITAQVNWTNVDADFGPLPASMHVYKTTDAIDGKLNIAYYVSFDLKDKSHALSTAVGNGKRYTPQKFYDSISNKPLLVMNATFFEFAHNSNLNLVVDGGEIKSYHLHSLPGKGKDTLTYRHVFGAALGISKSNKPDVAWVYTDTADANVYASQTVVPMFKDSVADVPAAVMLSKGDFKKWKVKTAIGGGPVLLQDGAVKITNNEELKFAGKAISDKHPRTAVGYTANNELILFVCEGRFKGRADGLTLTEMATLMQQIGCVEALNLDGGGSSCLLINGKETIKPSDKEGQRPVPAVFMIR